jgi:hypothetical protein
MLYERSSSTTTSRPPAPVGRRARLGAVQERAREREREQQHGEAAQQEERQVAQPAAPHHAVRDAPHEHQRRERERRLALAVDQVDHHRTASSASPPRNHGVRKLMGV